MSTDLKIPDTAPPSITEIETDAADAARLEQTCQILRRYQKNRSYGVFEVHMQSGKIQFVRMRETHQIQIP